MYNIFIYIIYLHIYNIFIYNIYIYIMHAAAGLASSDSAAGELFRLREEVAEMQVGATCG
jgi:hypothetical protein